MTKCPICKIRIDPDDTLCVDCIREFPDALKPQVCCTCRKETGKEGPGVYGDSLYIGSFGPFCEECYLRNEHNSPEKCSTWYDGCNCTPETCNSLMDRINVLELELETLGANAMKAMELKDEEIERLKEVREGQVAHTATLFSYWEDLAVEAGWSKAEDLASPMQFIRQFVRTRLVPNSSKPTAEQERAAVVKWLRDTIYDPHRDYLAERIEVGDHWPEEETL